jgi:hypothetical protein
MCKAAAVLGLALLAQTVPAPAAPMIAAHTNVVVVDAKAMQATAHANGYCWVTSIASQRRDAYRCMVGNRIYDPCFERSQEQVACPADASKNTGLLMTLTKPLPQPHASPIDNVWQMRLASGALCSAGTGTTLPGYPFYCTGNLVCSAPPAGSQQRDAVFVRCAQTSDAKTGAPGSYLATTLYE